MKILVNDKLATEAINMLKDAGYEVDTNSRDHDGLIRDIGNFDGILVRSGTKVKTDIVEKGAEGNLKVIGRAGIGVDNIDIETAGKKGIPVVNSPSGATASVAELAIGHMLALSRNIPRADSTMRKKEWAKKQLKGNELFEKTLGLIGSGGIAQYTSKIANGFGMNVLVYSPHCTEEKAKKMGAKLSTFEEILKNSDFVSLHVPHNKDTHYIIDKKELSLMKDSAYLIDVSRGGVVNQKALYNHLKEGKIAGAAIDVYEEEPPKDNLFIEFENVVLTPHLGANTKEGQIRAGTVCAEQIIKVLKGETPEHCVNTKFLS